MEELTRFDVAESWCWRASYSLSRHSNRIVYVTNLRIAATRVKTGRLPCLMASNDGLRWFMITIEFNRGLKYRFIKFISQIFCNFRSWEGVPCRNPELYLGRILSCRWCYYAWYCNMWKYRCQWLRSAVWNVVQHQFQFLYKTAESLSFARYNQHRTNYDTMHNIVVLETNV